MFWIWLHRVKRALGFNDGYAEFDGTLMGYLDATTRRR